MTYRGWHCGCRFRAGFGLNILKTRKTIYQHMLTHMLRWRAVRFGRAQLKKARQTSSSHPPIVSPHNPALISIKTTPVTLRIVRCPAHEPGDRRRWNRRNWGEVSEWRVRQHFRGRGCRRSRFENTTRTVQCQERLLCLYNSVCNLSHCFLDRCCFASACLAVAPPSPAALPPLKPW